MGTDLGCVGAGASADADQALAVPVEPFGLAPTGFDPSRGGRLGETPVLWRFRMQYRWNDGLAQDDPDWDQCCTCWQFALTEQEARRKVWDKFKHPHSVMPVSIASCDPERYQNERDIAIAAAAREGGDAQQAPGNAPQSGGTAASPDLHGGIA